MKNLRLCGLIELLTRGQNGVHSTYVEGVRLFRFNKPTRRQTFFCAPSLVIVCQGRRLSYFNRMTLNYDEDHCVTFATSLPIQSQDFASEDEPLMGLIIEFNFSLLQDIWSQIAQDIPRESIKRASAKIAYSMLWKDSTKVLVERLLTHLADPESAKIFSKDTLKEIYYRALRDDKTSPLYALLDNNNHLAHLATLIAYIKEHLNEEMTIAHLSQLSKMNSVTFFRIFKKMTGESPIQYIKKMRLYYAKIMLQGPGNPKIVSVSHLVGYESPSQFSREFKRLFGVAPKRLQSTC